MAPEFLAVHQRRFSLPPVHRSRMTLDSPRLAVLIDAENAQLGTLGNLLAEIAKYGSASVRRVYGDFTSQSLAPWRDPMLAHSIQPIQQFRNTVHKNASDSALIIDAMDLLHSGRLDGFCIVSSDSDFTRLASRIREEGLLVYGFGEKQTPPSFIAACHKFTYTEILRSEPAAQSETAATVHQVALPALAADNAVMRHLSDAVEHCADEQGWARMAEVGRIVANHVPDFDSRHYGFRKLSSLLESTGRFELERQGDVSPTIFVKLKDSGGKPAQKGT